MERLLAALSLLLISPIFFVLFLAVKSSSKGSFLFQQKRAGKNFKIFTIYKIRTMVENAENLKNNFKHLNEVDSPVFKIRDDPRFTRAGKLISSIGLDEIPQLINIIKGEMSFVGPRPLPIDEALKTPKKYESRFSVKPGVTCLWIIKGAHKLSFLQWMELDLEYIKKKNFLLDLSIFSNTAALVIKWTFQKLFVSFS
ncbi:MAG: sugar transferase [bacterium]|nr:sugar transferase [bacterium]